MRKVDDGRRGCEDAELVLVVLVVLVKGDEVAVDVGLAGVKINHRIKEKSIGVIFDFSGEPCVKELCSWLRGIIMCA